MSRKSLNAPEVQTLAAATKLTANDDGARIMLALAGGFAVTLPPPEAGLEFEFFVKVAPTTAYTIVTHASANIIVGQVLSNDLNAASDGDFEATGGDTFTFVANKAVKGDTVKFFCDGVNWYASAFVSVFDAATITTAS
jgi:hypothetical protein